VEGPSIRIPLPRITPGLASNLVGLLSFVGLLVAVGSLLDWRWSLLLASLIGAGVSYVAHMNGQAATAKVRRLDEARKARAA
jgi:hypothetical protein